jgi:hypothetical protein
MKKRAAFWANEISTMQKAPLLAFIRIKDSPSGLIYQ